VIGAVLAQKKIGVPDEKIVPTFLDLDDPVHRLIYDRELNYEPVTFYKHLPVCLPKASQEKTIPPNISEMSQFISFDAHNVDDSLFLSAASILAVYNCRAYSSTI